MTAAPRVLTVDDQELIRIGFRLVLQTQDDIEVVGEAADGHDALEQSATLRPDVVLMDIRMPRMDGVEATALLTAAGSPPRVLAGLTEREREVLALVAEGLSNDEIAGRLFLSPLTAKTHVSRIMTKLNARDRAQLVVIAYESGLVTPGGRG